LGCLLIAACASVWAQNVDMRDTEPDSANFPNGAYTIAKGHVYVENSPLGFYSLKKPIPDQYQWEFLIRYGWTDRIELRVFSDGLTVKGDPDPATGFSPLAFDVKASLWRNPEKRFVPSVGAEAYIQTELGSSAFDSGINPSINVLLDHNLPGGITLEYNLGLTRQHSKSSDSFYFFSFPWSVSHKAGEDLDVFVHGYYGSTTLPKLQNLRAIFRQAPSINAIGGGALWTINSRVAIWGSYNVGTTQQSPTSAVAGFAVAF
jgi:outer membrane putative beta-barrel porin/alpha-amylase